jgi:hypothetical protein
MKGRAMAGAETPAERSSNLINSDCITKEWRLQGLKLREDGDHIVELREGNQVLARFSQTGVTVENLLKVTEEAVQERRN